MVIYSIILKPLHNLGASCEMISPDFHNMMKWYMEGGVKLHCQTEKISANSPSGRQWVMEILR
jgi:hypothetical protein